MAGIGHNRGPSLEPGVGWRKHCWTRARNEVIKKPLPLEIVRQRVRRAEELGLAYPQYASILMGTGRDIVGFLFTCDALGLRLRQRLEMPGPVRDKLSEVVGADLLAFAPSGEAPEAFRAELSDVSGLTFTGSGAVPEDRATWREVGTAMRAVLEPVALPARSVVLIGTRDAEEGWVTPGRLARFLDAGAYFGRAA